MAPEQRRIIDIIGEFRDKYAYKAKDDTLSTDDKIENLHIAIAFSELISFILNDE